MQGLHPESSLEVVTGWFLYSRQVQNVEKGMDILLSKLSPSSLLDHRPDMQSTAKSLQHW